MVEVDGDVWMQWRQPAVAGGGGGGSGVVAAAAVASILVFVFFVHWSLEQVGH
jgi:hypothetical protein